MMKKMCRPTTSTVLLTLEQRFTRYIWSLCDRMEHRFWYRYLGRVLLWPLPKFISRKFIVYCQLFLAKENRRALFYLWIISSYINYNNSTVQLQAPVPILYPASRGPAQLQTENAIQLSVLNATTAILWSCAAFQSAPCLNYPPCVRKQIAK